MTANELVETMTVDIPVAVTVRNGTFYIPLPEEYRKAVPGGCSCGKPGCTSEWDTLAVHDKDVWVVHFPELRQQCTQTVTSHNATAT